MYDVCCKAEIVEINYGDASVLSDFNTTVPIMNNHSGVENRKPQKTMHVLVLYFLVVVSMSHDARACTPPLGWISNRPVAETVL